MVTYVDTLGDDVVRQSKRRIIQREKTYGILTHRKVTRVILIDHSKDLSGVSKGEIKNIPGST